MAALVGALIGSLESDVREHLQRLIGRDYEVLIDAFPAAFAFLVTTVLGVGVAIGWQYGQLFRREEEEVERRRVYVQLHKRNPNITVPEMTEAQLADPTPVRIGRFLNALPAGILGAVLGAIAGVLVAIVVRLLINLL